METRKDPLQKGEPTLTEMLAEIWGWDLTVPTEEELDMYDVSMSNLKGEVNFLAHVTSFPRFSDNERTDGSEAADFEKTTIQHPSLRHAALMKAKTTIAETEEARSPQEEQSGTTLPVKVSPVEEAQKVARPLIVGESQISSNVIPNQPEVPAISAPNLEKATDAAATNGFGIPLHERIKTKKRKAAVHKIGSRQSLSPLSRASKKPPKQKRKKQRSEEDADIFEVERILDVQITYDGGEGEGNRRVRYLVAWKGYPDESENTWEPEENLESAPLKVKEFWDSRKRNNERSSAGESPKREVKMEVFE
ncbi:uncharacterized protein SPPG_04314 [Spizellomyces punctatus DAOM BR117]|uniref:Chromo domain-containing protein n=1 Tax=Spizellomyces punctatus (strain DAOM BR117) TaxID=645134 RepID=A0A0L0HJL8_SPIPD|nr:uncharacterized protein SPPG_04314 [Spizellomyces punctatus DAOM BR117]KND01223.1 hypothetical protein SPPG_04314 [Spizellomyces punctatus DAOM BR117]|eukprot:XP_016609262.1 hypothetical protein SPPG_04314 [Spizellomyces punctatus DAOM BR117]